MRARFCPHSVLVISGRNAAKTLTFTFRTWDCERDLSLTVEEHHEIPEHAGCSGGGRYAVCNGSTGAGAFETKRNSAGYSKRGEASSVRNDYSSPGEIQRDAAGCAGAADGRACGSDLRAVCAADGRRGAVARNTEREAGWKRKLHGPAWGEQRERGACGAIHFR